MISDYHIHSDYSDDSWHLMEDVIQDALELGLEEICFTEHVDYGVKVDWDEPIDPNKTGISLSDEQMEEIKNLYKDVDFSQFDLNSFNVMKNVDYPLYFKEIKEVKEKYKDKITIKAGLEFGIQMHTLSKYRSLFNQYKDDLDFILLSVHQINDIEFWEGSYQKGKTIEECYEGYYNELYEIITNYHDYSCLAHMDLMRRYVMDKNDRFEDNKEIITKILKTVITDGKGIELNTSSYRYGIEGPTPSIEILKLYRELGGTIITIGSDSHQKDNLGSHIKESMKILKELGFDSICTYEKMKPIFHKL